MPVPPKVKKGINMPKASRFKTAGDIENGLAELGAALKAQFNLLADADMNDPVQLQKIQEQSQKSQGLGQSLGKKFRLRAENGMDLLAKIADHAEAKGIAGADGLKETLTHYDAMVDLLPKDACATPQALQDAARQVLKLPPKP